MAHPTPTADELDELILSARYGEADEVKEFAEKYGWDAVAGARDEHGNSALHMACGNGHLDVLKLILEHAPATLLTATNEAGSPALHWAVLNNHVACVQALVDVPEERGGGIALLKQENRAGRDAFGEAMFAGEGKEEVAGWIEGYLWKAEGGDDADEKTEITTDVTVKEIADKTAELDVSDKVEAEEESKDAPAPAAAGKAA